MRYIVLGGSGNHFDYADILAALQPVQMDITPDYHKFIVYSIFLLHVTFLSNSNR